MPAKVVCISRTLAAGGEEIGQAVAERLGWRVIDAEIVQRAAEKAGLDASKVAQTEQRQPLIRRLISLIAFAEPPQDLAPQYYSAFPEAAFAVGQTLEERMRGLIRAVIEEVAGEGQAVIVAHAERVDYFRRFYELDEELPTHYDLVLNTDQLPPEAAVAAIIAVVTAGSP